MSIWPGYDMCIQRGSRYFDKIFKDFNQSVTSQKKQTVKCHVTSQKN